MRPRQLRRPEPITCDKTQEGDVCRKEGAYGRREDLTTLIEMLQSLEKQSSLQQQQQQQKRAFGRPEDLTKRINLPL